MFCENLHPIVFGAIFKGNYEVALQYIDRAFQKIPYCLQANHKNKFLLERADCYWNLKDYHKCINILQEVNSNGLPIACDCTEMHKMIYNVWMSRGNDVLDSNPSLAKILFEWSFRHGRTLTNEARSLVLNGVATWLSGDHSEGRRLILRGSKHCPIIKEMVSVWEKCGLKALAEKNFTASKNIFQRSLILISSNYSTSSSYKETKSCILGYQATAHFYLNEYQTALEKGMMAYALNPIFSTEQTKKWQGFFQVLERKRMRSLAIQYLSLASRYAPPSNKVLRYKLFCQRSIVYHEMEDFQHAVEDGRNATLILPDDVEGYKCLVNCYKNLDDSQALIALNQCLRTQHDSNEKLKFLKEAISIAVKLQEGTTALTIKVPVPLIQKVQEEAIISKDWEILRLLYLGGGGPQRFQVNKGGLATGLRAEQVAIINVVSGNFSNKPETLAALLMHGAPLNCNGGDSDPLVSAVENGQVEVVKVLLDHGANPCVKTNDDLPLLHHIVQNAIDTGNFQMVQVLLDSGHTDIKNAQDSKGNTLYHLAMNGKINNKKCKVIRLLLNAKVNPTLPNKQGKKPLDCCKKDDDRSRMLERFLREINQTENSKCLLFPTSKLENKEEKRDITTLCLVQSCDKTKHGKCTAGKGLKLKLETTTTKSADLKHYLEHLIESVIIVQNDDEQSEVEFYKEPEEAKHEIDDAKKVGEMFSNLDVSDEKVNLGCAKAKKVEEKWKNTQGEKYENKNMVDQDEGRTEIENLEWEVDFSDKFLKSFRSKNLQPEMRKKIMEKIWMLAQGRWSKTLCKRLEGEPKKKGILLYESKLTNGARMLWEQTIAFSHRSSNDPELTLRSGQGVLYSDIIRVWDVVLDHGNLEREIQNVVRSIVKSHERGSHCIIRTKLKGMRKQTSSSCKLSFPTFYQEYDECSRPVEGERIFSPPASPEENEYHILKFHPFTSAIIESLLDHSDEKTDINFPFKVTELEHAIVNLKPDPPCPIILLGRSGTGKTTCCLYRLWNEFQNYWEKAVTAGPLFPRYIPPTTTSDLEVETKDNSSSSLFDGLAMGTGYETKMEERLGMKQNSLERHEHFHPLFITKNNVLCSEVRKNFKELSYASSVTKSLSTVSDEDSLPNRIQDIGEMSWPLFIGSRDWLILLDASLPGTTFFSRTAEGNLLERIEGWGEYDTHLQSIPDKEENDSDKEEEQNDDDDYGDGIGIEVEYATAEKDHRQEAKARKTEVNKKEITYEVFRDELWPKMKQRKKVDYHPTLVWTEIKSFIKGSFEALKTDNGFLSLKEYQELGRKRSTNFMEDRSMLYGLFEIYERLRASKGMFDETDLVYHLYKRIPNDINNLPWSIHSVYVDETQDFTQAELSLLIRCCRFQNRMFFTGDTAQSIMKGIAFRFEDLKTLFHNIMSLNKTKSEECVRTPDRLYQLTYNYRSHSGILKLASSVLSMLLYYFPESIDKLEEDRGLFKGPKPVVLESCSVSDLATILQENKRETPRIEFGAHQAVLVASEEARDNMPDELKQGLVLTIYEAKGLEFDDVLIYNFFTDSQAKKEWKIVTINFGCEQMEIKNKALHFEPSKHNVLISELKFLYTAITRARVNAWFFDEDEEARAPMFQHFKKLNLVRTTLDEEGEGTDSSQCEEYHFSTLNLVHEISFESKVKVMTTDKWRDQGMFFYNNGRWAVAEKCFSFADDELMIRKSKAHQLAQEALKHRQNSRQVKEMFLSAAIGFLECNMAEETAVCLQNARERLLLAKFYMKVEKFADAARLFKSVGHYVKASECMENLNNYREAIEILCEAKLFLKAIEVLERYNSLGGDKVPGEDLVPPDSIRTIKQLCYKAAEAYLNDGKTKEMEFVLKRLPSLDERIAFLKEKCCFTEAARALVENNRREEAAQFLHFHGKFKEARKYSDDHSFLANCYLCEARSLIKAQRLNYQEDVAQLLEKAVKYYRQCEDQNGEREALFLLGRHDDHLNFESGSTGHQRHL